ncbi:Holliday junction branch migration protein RuvA [Desulfoferrobacter suflitae]|uniref:Holliday junction branch migration protein RuvA n=1 Tax=Desulfoferrobacter suflitae TaxID=2865782 RepID=UPI002164CB68|nr:Holliday junction branch migration protein RuvA [Desulfoferrobacter suflitae]MCK8601370.1 Holliday junction branch migration protein RuvA [Desulfoferrobacter suflitae]
MIGYLAGKLKHKSPDYLIIDVNGVGYCVHVPLSTFYDMPAVGETISLNIHTHVREDMLQLYGFRTLAEKEMFLHLIAINGVGPRLAIGILSGITPDGLRAAVLQQDHRRLKNIPGIGKKIAERIALELRDKLKIKPAKEELVAPPAGTQDVFSDAYSALLNLGYRASEIDKSLKRVQQKLGDTPALESLLKEALRVLA